MRNIKKRTTLGGESGLWGAIPVAADKDIVKRCQMPSSKVFIAAATFVAGVFTGKCSLSVM